MLKYFKHSSYSINKSNCPFPVCCFFISFGWVSGCLESLVCLVVFFCFVGWLGCGFFCCCCFRFGSFFFFFYLLVCFLFPQTALSSYLNKAEWKLKERFLVRYHLDHRTQNIHLSWETFSKGNGKQTKKQVKLLTASVANLAPPNIRKLKSHTVLLKSENNNNKSINFKPSINLVNPQFWSVGICYTTENSGL